MCNLRALGSDAADGYKVAKPRSLDREAIVQWWSLASLTGIKSSQAEMTKCHPQMVFNSVFKRLQAKHILFNLNAQTVAGSLPSNGVTCNETTFTK